MKRLLLSLIFTLLFAFFGFSQQNQFQFFEQSTFGKPFLSAIRSPMMKVEALKLNYLDENYYINNYAKRPFIETHFGVDIPIVAYHNQKKNLSLKLNADIGTIVLVDMFEHTTAPVINNDYFFGLSISAMKNLHYKKLRNIGLQFVPIFHESTHLGDEFVLHGKYLIPDFKRINVSYEAWELSLVLNDPDTIRENLCAFKFGMHALWFPSSGYYDIDSLEVGGAEITHSSKHVEYFLQFNYQRTQGFLCSKSWVHEISVEARNRLKFSYELVPAEERLWCLNAYFGYRHLLKNQKSSLGFYFRYYYGLNPHGQLRNNADFQSFGCSMVYR